MLRGLDGRWSFHDRRPAFFIPLNCSGFQGMDITIDYSNSTSDNLHEAKTFTRNNSSILKNHSINPVCFFLDLLFCEEAQNYKIGISVKFFWKISTRTGFFFCRKWEVAIIIISSVLVSMNINANLFSFL